MSNTTSTPLVGILMGSKSDWETMQLAHETLTQFGIPHECRVLSAHRTPHETAEFVTSSEKNGSGLRDLVELIVLSDPFRKR